MFTIEHEFDATVITLIDEVGDGQRPLFEDITIQTFDDRVVVEQADADGQAVARIVFSIEKRDELPAAQDLPQSQ